MNKAIDKKDIKAKFLDGPILRHIFVMTSTSAAGLVGIFLVDLLDMYFLSLLGSEAILAGVGFATSISFFTVSLSIGITISMGALVSRSIGQDRPEQARRYVINVAVLGFCLTGSLSVLISLNLPALFRLLGADPEATEIGTNFLYIVLPSLPILATGMALSAAIRAAGDAKLSMYTTLFGGAINAVLDPILIFGLDLGVQGAAIATVLARCGILSLALYGVTRKHHLTTHFSMQNFSQDLRPILAIAGPAMLTNIFTPIGNFIVLNAIAKFGGAYVASFSIINRISPVAFGLVFALSGAVAPIIGQNFGAKMYDRVKQTIVNALMFNAVYVTVVSLMLFLLQDVIIRLFNLTGEAAELMQVFCTWIAISFMFNGAQFVANASFNNLGKPIYATWFNVGRATLGTLPFVMVGAQLGGPSGVLVGQAVGGFLFAVVAVIVAFRHTNTLSHTAPNT